MEVIVKQLGTEYNRSTYACPPKYALRGRQRTKIARWVISCVKSVDELFLCMWILDRVRRNNTWSVQMAAVLVANKTHTTSTLSNARAIDKYSWNIDAATLFREEVDILVQVGWHVPLLMVSTCIAKMSRLFVNVNMCVRHMMDVCTGLIMNEPNLCCVDVCTRAILLELHDNAAAIQYWNNYVKCLYKSFN